MFYFFRAVILVSINIHPLKFYLFCNEVFIHTYQSIAVNIIHFLSSTWQNHLDDSLVTLTATDGDVGATATLTYSMDTEVSIY